MTLRKAVSSLEHKRSFWAPDNQLRHKAISFVSGGTTGASFDIPPKEYVEKRDDSTKNAAPLDVVEAKTNLYLDHLHGPGKEPEQPAFINEATETFHDIDMEGTRPSTSRAPSLSPSLIAQQAPKRKPSSSPHRRAPSPTPSNSSEEVVVFAGRNRPRQPAKKAATQKTTPSQTAAAPSFEVTVHNQTAKHPAATSDSPGQRPQSELYFYDVPPPRTVAEDEVDNRSGNEVDTISANGDAESLITKMLGDQHLLDRAEATPSKETPIPRRRKRRTRKRTSKKKTPDGSDDIPDDVLDDYLQNLKANGEILDNVWENEVQGSAAAEVGGWGNTELEDLHDLSTSEEMGEIISHVLSRRERPSGLQYLVVWEGQVMDEARWIHHEALSHRQGADVMIAEFENQRRLQLWNEAQAAEIEAEVSSDVKADKVFVGPTDSDHEEDGEESDDEDDEDAEDDNSDDIDDSYDDDDYGTEDLPLSDEEDLIQRRKERMTDEHIARLLQRQEELGMHGDELVLFDGLEDGLEDGVDLDDIDLFADPASQPSSRPRRRRKHKGRTTNNTISPSAGLDDSGLEGDDYGNFDIMDRSRPSLSRKAKNKIEKEVAAFNLSDSDLERQLADSWAADKQKKKAKKIEREELRAEGLLGLGSKKAGKAAAKKRSPGISINDFEDELQNFLDGGEKKLALPPLDKKLRKFVHEMANQFGLKSKSHGSGTSRYPVLLKTVRTKSFDAALFDRMEMRLWRRFGLDGSSSRRGKVPKPFGGRDGGGHSLADGQLVGAGAKEIGVENKGRAMLEKMGWSKGTALGAVDNKGILIPVDSVMKKTRAGLG